MINPIYGNEEGHVFSTLCYPCPYDYDCETCRKEMEESKQNSSENQLSNKQEQKLQDFKDTLIETIKTTKSKNPIEITSQLLDVLYAKGFSDGQGYLMEEMKEDENSDD